MSYHFPPDAGVGASRPAKFAKYLPACGWDPIILTVKEKYYPMTDRSRAADLKDIREIYRTRMLPHPGNLYLTMKTLFRGRNHQSNPLAHDEVRNENVRRVGSLKRLLFSLEHLPDNKQVWIPVAVLHGLRIIRARKVECVLTSSPPMSCHVIGLLLHKLSGVKWIADFRDPWVSNTGKGADSRSRFSDIVEEWLEEATLRSAAKVVTASDGMQQDFCMRYQFVEPKIETILNGYDPDDHSDVTRLGARRDHEVFTLTHAGTMYKNREATPFLVGVSNLIKSGRIPKGRIQVNFIGEPGPIRGVLRNLGLTEVVKLIDFVDYRSCLQYLYASDALLLFAQGQPLQIPGKLYDYIAVGRVIIAFTGEGATADLVKRLDCGLIIDSDDPAIIAETVAGLYRQFEDGTLVGKRADMSGELTKRVLTKKLMNGIG